MIKLIRKWLLGFESKDQLTQDVASILATSLQEAKYANEKDVMNKIGYSNTHDNPRVSSDWSSTITVHTVKGGGFLVETNNIRTYHYQGQIAKGLLMGAHPAFDDVATSKDLHYAKDMQELGTLISEIVVIQQLQK